MTASPRWRASAEATLRGLRLRAAYRVARLSKGARTRHLAHGLEARGRAIDDYLAKEAAWADRAARVLGTLSGLEEDPGAEDRRASAHAALGALRAERARLDARLRAELDAFLTTERVLAIRSQALR